MAVDLDFLTLQDKHNKTCINTSLVNITFCLHCLTNRPEKAHLKLAFLPVESLNK